MSKRKGGPQKIKDPAEASAIALEWFNQENKPVTVQSLTDALGSRVSKPLVQRTLDALHSDGKLQAKDLKKVRFFFLKVAETTEPTDAAASGDSPSREDADGTLEEGSPSPPSQDSDGPDGEEAATEDEGGAEQSSSTDVVSRDALIAAIVDGARALQETDRALAAMMSVPTSAERADRLRALQADVDELSREVAAAEARAAATATRQGDSRNSPGAAWSAAAALDDAVYTYKTARALWKERRELVDRFIDSVLGDAYSKKELSDMFGLTTDADVGLSFATSAVHLPPSLAMQGRATHTARHRV